jgi:signal transduction histidine kinase
LVTNDGRVFIYAAYPLGRLPAALASASDTIILAVPRAGSLAILAGLIMPLTVGGILALLVSLIVAIVFARSIYRPINKLKDGAASIARGDYDQRIPPQGPREMQELAVSFNHMADEVKHSQAQLRHFVADVSHELKNPLTSIQGFSQALVDGTAGDDETRSKAADIINSESKRMRRQVDELLELSRMQSSQLKMAREPVDIDDVIARCHDIFDLQARDKGVRLIRRTSGSLTMDGDPDRLEQLFNNLLDNAIKNTQSGGQVAITATKDRDLIEIKVTDNGPGIPADQLPHVFERFYQVTGVRTGVGLGLAIAREIVSAHAGTIEARSQPGEGAEFIVRLPASGS